ncbi:MAG: hypothetical protein OXI63_21980 [Candidatus Poribacteria bacterium]|nr:hypothetical protein [Candidatus Poribacteria bacterium]
MSQSFAETLTINTDRFAALVTGNSLTAGPRHDVTEAPALITGYKCEYVIAGAAYDSDAFCELKKICTVVWSPLDSTCPVLIEIRWLQANRL